jgi:hypothetical protein
LYLDRHCLGDREGNIVMCQVNNGKNSENSGLPKRTASSSLSSGGTAQIHVNLGHIAQNPPPA